MQTSRLSVTLPESEIDFLKQYAKKEKTTIPKLIDRWIKSLRAKGDIHPDIKKFTGMIQPDIDKAITDSLELKSVDKNVLFEKLCGLWEGREEVTLEGIRDIAWKRT